MAKVLLGLSGGVDSAVAAYLLKKQGHDVTCLFMRNWDSTLNNDQYGNPTLNDPICPQERDYNDAKKVAKDLGLPLLRVDFIKQYWDDVFQTFLDEYAKGRTPNPDILCNRYIKFLSFFDYAISNGYDYVATGHYAKVIHTDSTSYLVKGEDINKDQSYFLCEISINSLKKTLFPLGEINKTEVRKIALDLNLDIAAKKDSTGVCFIGERDFKQFLSNYLPAKSGNIVNLATGQVLRQHDGVLYYTIGQRKGLGIGGAGGPYVVVGKDIYRNELYVVNQNDNYWLYSDRCLITDINWFNIPNSNEFECNAKFRYRQSDNPVKVEILTNNCAMVYYPHRIPSIAIGQACVFYDGDICLGGGTIDKTYINDDDKQDLIKEKRNGQLE